jgi:HD-GYP domain-containing protein (c-di-GMP phosphodiesterase class II)
MEYPIGWISALAKVGWRPCERRKMGPQTRLFVYLCAAQAGCLAAGLWAHYQLVSAMESAAAAQVAAAAATPGNASSQANQESTDSSLVYPLSFFWICGLQCVAAWLLLQRVNGQQHKKDQQSHEETLLTAKELVRTRDAVIFGLAKLAESRDPDTGHHLERIALYATRLASALRRHPKYRNVVSLSFVRMIGISSALHDIGKVGVEDSILLKPGKLTDVERFRIQIHTTLGGDCIRQIEQRLGNSNFLQMAREIAFFHHERWDGNGYPHKLKGEEIPLSARIVAIADTYDAMAVKRVYKEAYPHEVCVDRIRREAGQQFDPDLVEVFLTIEQQFRDIAQSFSQDQPGTTQFDSEFIAGSAGDSRRSERRPDEVTARPAEITGATRQEHVSVTAG